MAFTHDDIYKPMPGNAAVGEPFSLSL